MAVTPASPPLWRRALVALLYGSPSHGALLGLIVFLLEGRGARGEGFVGLWLAITDDQPRLLVASAVVGAALGLAAAALGWVWDWGRGARRGRLGRAGRNLGLILLLHAACFARGVILYPQLYEEGLYDRGGLGRALQLTLTHHLPLWLLQLGLALGLTAAVVLPLWRRVRVWHLPASAPAWRAWVPGAARDLRAVVVAALAVVTIAGMAVVAALPPRVAARGPNLLIIAVDSLRSDRVGAENAAVAPTLADLARRGVHFRQAYVTLPRTFPSWVTLLTGRYPNHHGVRTMYPTIAERARVTGALPEVLRRHGYRTAVVSDFAGDMFTRIDLGFDTVRAPAIGLRDMLAQPALRRHCQLMPYLASRRGRRYAPAMAGLAENADPELLTGTAIATLRQLARGERFCLTVFYSVAHFPYASPDPYYRKFADPSYRGPFLYQKPSAMSPPTLSMADLRQIQALYNGAVNAADRAIARLLAEVARLGLAENTVVVVTADHGELLLDEGHDIGHGEHLQGDGSLNVPLVIYDPVHRFTPRRLDALVRDVDVAPTLTRLLGVPSPASADGVDLGPLLRGERRDLDLRVYHETGLWMLGFGLHHGPGERIYYPPVTEVTEADAARGEIVLKREYHDLVNIAKHRAVRTRDWKLIYVPRRDGVRYLLFDLKRDPEQRVDVAAAHPEVIAELRADLVAWMLSQPGVELRRDYVLPRP